VRKAGRDRNEIREAVLLALGCFIVLVWAVATLVPTLFPSPSRPPVDGQVHVIALAVVVGLFGAAGLAGRRSSNGNGKDSTGA
jgi:hypothetical protein